jgi:hypothetical protein
MIGIAVTNRKNAFALVIYVLCIVLRDAVALRNFELGMWEPIQTRRFIYGVFRELPQWEQIQ